MFLVSDYSEDESLEGCDILFVTLLSHGDRHGVILTNRGKYNTSDVWNAFKEHKHLQGKPKIFIIAVCYIININILVIN